MRRYATLQHVRKYSRFSSVDIIADTVVTSFAALTRIGAYRLIKTLNTTLMELKSDLASIASPNMGSGGPQGYLERTVFTSKPLRRPIHQ